MMRLVTHFTILAWLTGALAAAPPALPAQAGGKPAVIRACSLLAKSEVKRIAAPNDQFFDIVPPQEDSLGGGGSACSYSGITIQIDPFTPVRLEELRKQKGALWTAVPDAGDAAYLFDNNNPNAGLHYAELYVRAGQRVVTIQLSVRPPTASVESVRPAAVALAKALIAKLP
jgi:hypothetical protein